jgi:hypothetical protein
MQMDKLWGRVALVGQRCCMVLSEAFGKSIVQVRIILRINVANK